MPTFERLVAGREVFEREGMAVRVMSRLTLVELNRRLGSPQDLANTEAIELRDWLDDSARNAGFVAGRAVALRWAVERGHRDPQEAMGGRSARVRGNTTRPMRAARDATIDDMKEAPMKVTLTEPGLAGSYDVVERREDGTLVLRPETSDEVIEQFADRVLTAEEFVGSLERLHAVKLREEQ